MKKDFENINGYLLPLRQNIEHYFRNSVFKWSIRLLLLHVTNHSKIWNKIFDLKVSVQAKQ